MSKRLLLLGASGNIGTQALDLLEKDPSYELVGVSVGSNLSFLENFLSSWKHSAITHAYLNGSEEDVARFRSLFPNVFFYRGEKGLGELVKDCPADYVLNAIVGFAGFLPSYVASSLGKTLLLANKESLVVGGALIDEQLVAHHQKIIPIDSEHAAFAKCLDAAGGRPIDRFIITCSGGPFYRKTPSELSNVTPEAALSHPTWKMGKKITIDSATLFNKGFELVEAGYLFGIDPSSIEVRVDRRSHVHSAILLKDGTYLADVGPSDMHGPIGYALSLGKGHSGVIETKDLASIPGTDFEPFDAAESPAIQLVLQGYRLGGTALASLNAANEEAVHLFLEKRIPFLSIYEAARLSLSFPIVKEGDPRWGFEALSEADHAARAAIRKRYLEKP